MTIILDLGGVIMQHNMDACVAHFRELIGSEAEEYALGLTNSTIGTEHGQNLIEQFEKGNISTEGFLSTLLSYAKTGTTSDDLKDAWNLMHGGIPAERLALLRRWRDDGHHLFMLSNNNALHWEDVFNKYDLSMFEHCFASHLLHCSKPDPAIYELVDTYLHTHQLGMPYHFVDDLAVNRHAAESVGWHTYPDLESLNVVLQQSKKV